MARIEYKNNENGELLGVVTCSDMSEVLIPDFKPEKHDVFLRNTFVSEPDFCLWQVMGIEIEDRLVEINLNPMISPDSLGVFARKQKKKPSTILTSREIQLVEVEFGFQQDVFDGDNRKRNEKSSIALMPGEIHKKRPCAVLHCEDEKAQVIPLTTSVGTGKPHPKKMSVSEDSFSGLSNRYIAKESQLLLSMIQTVSVYRIFPMKNKQGKYSNDYSKHKLCREDKVALQKLLANTYAKKTFDELTNSNNLLHGLKQEKMKILRTSQDLKNTVVGLTEMNQTYRDTLLKLLTFIGEDVAKYEENLIEKANKLIE